MTWRDRAPAEEVSGRDLIAAVKAAFADVDLKGNRKANAYCEHQEFRAVEALQSLISRRTVKQLLSFVEFLDRKHDALLWEASERAGQLQGFELANKELKERMSRATRFSDDGRFSVELREDGDWSICTMDSVFNASGEWEWEPRPSGQSKEFRDRTRFSLHEAWAKFDEAKDKWTK